MALNKGIWDPKLRGTKIKGTNLKSLRIGVVKLEPGSRHVTGFPAPVLGEPCLRQINQTN